MTSSLGTVRHGASVQNSGPMASLDSPAFWAMGSPVGGDIPGHIGPRRRQLLSALYGRYIRLRFLPLRLWLLSGASGLLRPYPQARAGQHRAARSDGV